MQDDPKRGTGRTTRMLQEAVRLALEGKEVVVVGADTADCCRLLDEAWKIMPASPDPGNPWIRRHSTLELRRIGPGGIAFWRSQNRKIEWDDLRAREMPEGTVLLIDHYAIELRFRNLLEMLHRFDTKG